VTATSNPSGAARATATTAATPLKRFGQSALATPANAVTITRIAIALPALVLIYQRGASWLTVGLWFAATASDSLDGWLARRDGATRSGAFLDPLADKTIVLGGLGVLVARGAIAWWPVALIALRELGISFYRSVAGKRGVVLPAQRLGKYKAFMQYSAVGLVVLPITKSWIGVQETWLGVAVVLTVASGLQIVRRGYVDWQRDK
jgi:CDP-diacylglycerol--glycerol-3-phosphate 3-phosphatidyltransferase